MDGIQLLKDRIEMDEGLILSVDTLKTKDLLEKALDLIEAYELDNEDNINMGSQIRALLDELDKYEDSEEVEKGELEALQRTNDLWNEEIIPWFNELAPYGYYFGATEGDGACIGFFREDDDIPF